MSYDQLAKKIAANNGWGSAQAAVGAGSQLSPTIQRSDIAGTGLSTNNAPGIAGTTAPAPSLPTPPAPNPVSTAGGGGGLSTGGGGGGIPAGGAPATPGYNGPSSGTLLTNPTNGQPAPPTGGVVPVSVYPNGGITGSYSVGGTHELVNGSWLTNPYGEGAIQAYGSPQAAAQATGANLADWTQSPQMGGFGGYYSGPTAASGEPLNTGTNMVAAQMAALKAANPWLGK